MSLKTTYSILIPLVLVGCVSNAAVPPRPSKMVADFYRMTTSEQIKQFKNHSLDDQYELFLFGNRVVHPPAIYLARPFAEQGPVIVPFLRGKLEVTSDEPTIRDITQILSQLAYLRLYSFSNDASLMALLERKAKGMHGIWKEETLKMISEIRR